MANLGPAIHIVHSDCMLAISCMDQLSCRERYCMGPHLITPTCTVEVTCM